MIPLPKELLVEGSYYDGLIDGERTTARWYAGRFHLLAFRPGQFDTSEMLVSAAHPEDGPGMPKAIFAPWQKLA